MIIKFPWLEKILTNKKNSFAQKTGNAVVEAHEHLARGENDAAIHTLKQRIEAVPGDAAAIFALAETYGKLKRRDEEIHTYHSLINLHLSAQEMEQAMGVYSLMLATYAVSEKQHRLILRDWMMLCDYLLSHNRWLEAANEYEKIGFAYEPHEEGFLAFVLAAELQMQMREYEYAANIFAYVRQNYKGDPSLCRRREPDCKYYTRTSRSLICKPVMIICPGNSGVVSAKPERAIYIRIRHGAY